MKNNYKMGFLFQLAFFAFALVSSSNSSLLKGNNYFFFKYTLLKSGLKKIYHYYYVRVIYCVLLLEFSRVSSPRLATFLFIILALRNRSPAFQIYMYIIIK